ncbi:MAG: glycosyltransferase, partial [Spirochaetaceae bacterium]|nr:glycosyltransferase [Spirochaetaceae bacterium]
QGDGNLFILDKVIPHGLFLSQCTAVIHHGGSGTTHSSARAGIPQMIAPMLIDQFYWAYRTGLLGAGPGAVKLKRIKPAVLEAKVLDLMENPRYKQNAAALGEKIRAEKGVQTAADYIEGKLKPA